jgi:hypothetical protein
MHHYRIIVDISIGENDIYAYWGNNHLLMGLALACDKHPPNRLLGWQ